MTKHSLPKKLEKLIGENKLKEVFEILSKMGFQEGSKNNLILLQRRYWKIQEDTNGHKMDSEYINQETNRIVSALLEFIDIHQQEIEAQRASSDPNSSVGHPRPSDDVYLYDGTYRRTVGDYELGMWVDFFEKSDYNKAQCQSALNAIREWKKEHQGKAIHRAWGTLKKPKEEVKWSKNRFWGLFNFRHRQDKWVWLAWDAEQSKLVFVKEVRPDCTDLNKVKRLEWEKNIYLKIGTQSASELLHTASKGVVSLIEHGEFWFATSLATYGNLHWQLFESNRISNVTNGKLRPSERVQKDIFKKLPNDAFSSKNWEMVQSLFIQIANTLAILHQSQYIHRDIHPANILINEFDVDTQTVSALICDFDRTRFDNGDFPNFLWLDGQELCAPERNKPHDKLEGEETNQYHGLPACDIYSLASILMIGLLEREVKDHSLRLRLLSEQTDWPTTLKNLLTDSMDINPKLRPDATSFALRLKAIKWPSLKEQAKKKKVLIWFSAFVFAILLYLPITSIFQWLNSDCRKYDCLAGELEKNLHLSAKKEYLLTGPLFVQKGTLSIEAGTKIYGKEGAFIMIGPNAKIEAQGEPYNPIQFTSWNARPGSKEAPEAGDWGGIAILGKAPVSKDSNLEFCNWLDNKADSRCNFGGEEPHHSSGTFRFVRIEYGGTIVTKNKEINGLTLAGVGDQTVIEYVLVNKVIDDCFEFFGGTVNAQYLICQDPGDDAFDFENGYNGELKYLLMKGGPTHNLQNDDEEGGARAGIEGTASDEHGEMQAPDPVISNVTLCYPSNLEGEEKIKPFNFDNDVHPRIRNVLIIGYIKDETKRLCAIDSLNIKEVNALPICDIGDLPEMECTWGTESIKPEVLIPGLPNVAEHDLASAYIGAFKSTEDHWEALLNF